MSHLNKVALCFYFMVAQTNPNPLNAEHDFGVLHLTSAISSRGISVLVGTEYSASIPTSKLSVSLLSQSIFYINVIPRKNRL